MWRSLLNPLNSKKLPPPSSSSLHEKLKFYIWTILRRVWWPNSLCFYRMILSYAPSVMSFHLLIIYASSHWVHIHEALLSFFSSANSRKFHTRVPTPIPSHHVFACIIVSHNDVNIPSCACSSSPVKPRRGESHDGRSRSFRLSHLQSRMF